MFPSFTKAIDLTIGFVVLIQEKGTNEIQRELLLICEFVSPPRKNV